MAKHKIAAKDFTLRFALLKRLSKIGKLKKVLSPAKIIIKGKIKARPKNSNSPIINEKTVMRKSLNLYPFAYSSMNL